jgi:hypothetical protein
VAVTSDAETMLAWERTRGDRSNLFVGAVVYDFPAPRRLPRAYAHVVAHPFELPPGGLEGTPSNPGLADIGSERFLLSWTQGNDEEAQLRAQPVAAWGDTVGPALDLSSSDVSVMGASSAAFTRNGSGAVAYFASTGDVIELMATPVYCSAPRAIPVENQIAHGKHCVEFSEPGHASNSIKVGVPPVWDTRGVSRPRGRAA